MLDQFIDNVYAWYAIDLLRRLPSNSIDAIIADPLYMVAADKQTFACTYGWGQEPGTGKAREFWALHEAVYHESRRVLKPGCPLAWSMGVRFSEYFPQWFGGNNGYRNWALNRFVTEGFTGKSPFNSIWMVQTKEQTPINFPPENGDIHFARSDWKKLHPCTKSDEEMDFMVRNLTKPGDIVLDYFCGIGSTLAAARRRHRHWIGCDFWEPYAKMALQRTLKTKPLNPADEQIPLRQIWKRQLATA